MVLVTGVPKEMVNSVENCRKNICTVARFGSHLLGLVIICMEWRDAASLQNTPGSGELLRNSFGPVKR